MNVELKIKMLDREIVEVSSVRIAKHVITLEIAKHVGKLDSSLLKTPVFTSMDE